MVVDKINKFLTERSVDLSDELLLSVGEQSKYIFKRQFGLRVESERKLRLSSIGKCIRQQAYNVLGFEVNGKELDSRSAMVFFQGDMAELAIVNLAKMAGCQVESEQEEINIEGIEGHPDGVLVCEDGLKRLLEVKSMSSYGFENFERGEIDEGYLYQINAYMFCFGLQEAVMVALNKDAGVLTERIILRDNVKIEDIKKRIESLKSVSKESLPERPYVVNEKGFLPWQCLYCAYYKTCRPTAEKVLVGRSYKLKEK